MTDEEQEAAKERQERERRQQETDLCAVLSTPGGRRFVWRLIDVACGTFGLSHSGEALSGAYNEGRRSIGVGLMLEAQQVSRRDYVQMLAESLEPRK